MVGTKYGLLLVSYIFETHLYSFVTKAYLSQEELDMNLAKSLQSTWNGGALFTLSPLKFSVWVTYIWH